MTAAGAVEVVGAGAEKAGAGAEMVGAGGAAGTMYAVLQNLGGESSMPSVIVERGIPN